MKKQEFYEFDLLAMDPVTQEVKTTLCTIDISKIIGYYPTISKEGKTIGTTLVLEGNVNIPIVLEYAEMAKILTDG